MRAHVLTPVALAAMAALAYPQTSATPRSPSPRPSPVVAVASPTPPPTISGYVVTVEIRAIAPEVKPPAGAAPEAQALASRLKNASSLTSRIWLGQDLSRQEIVSTDFVLPAGTLVLHKAGERAYLIADPKAKTYLVMDSEALLNALEGGAGVLNSQYGVKIQHTGEKKMVAGMPCRKSIVTVSYVSSIPLENDRVLVQQKNDIEVWHTSAMVSSAAMDHFFFKFQRDKTGEVQKALASDIGFPMEVHLTVTQGSGKKGAVAQPGSLHMIVTEAQVEKKLDSELFRIPPTGFKRTDKNPYFAAGALSRAGAEIAGEKKQ